MSYSKKPWREWWVRDAHMKGVQFAWEDKNLRPDCIRVIEIGAVEELEAESERQQLNYIKACKGRATFRELYRNSEARIKDLRTALEKIEESDRMGYGLQNPYHYYARESLEQDNKARGDENDT